MYFIHRILRYIWEILIENFTNGLKTNTGVQFSVIRLILFVCVFEFLHIVTTAFSLSAFREPQPSTKDNSKHLRLHLVNLFFRHETFEQNIYREAKSGFNSKETPQLAYWLQSFVKSRQLDFLKNKTKRL